MKIVYYNQTKTRITQRIKKGGLFITIFILAGWSFFWLPYFRISKLEIKDPLVSKKEIEEKLAPLLVLQGNGSELSHLFTRFFLPQNNLFLFPSQNAERIILESGLGVAKVEKKFPDKISIKFIEIKPKFLYCKEQNCFYIDKNGIPYETAPFFSESPLPVLELKKDLKLGEEFFPKNEANFLLELQKGIKKFGLEIKKINIDNDFKLTMNEGWYLTLLLEEKSPQNVVNKLSLIFERKIKDRSRLEYVDMRFQNKAFYKISP